MAEITESYIEIMNLVYAYPERIDAGDFAGVGELFAEATFETEGGEPLVGREAVQSNLERWTRRYSDDGTPLTGNFMDYALPAATEFPRLIQAHEELVGVVPFLEMRRPKSFDRLIFEAPVHGQARHQYRCPGRA